MEMYLIGDLNWKTSRADGFQSSCLYLNIGVPLGSVLGPIWFTIFVKALDNKSTYGAIQCHHLQNSKIFIEHESPFFYDNKIVLHMYKN